MLGTGCPDRHAFLFKRSSSLPATHDRDACPPARAGSFFGAERSSAARSGPSGSVPQADLQVAALTLPHTTRAAIRSAIHLSIQTSSMRQLLKMLLTMKRHALSHGGCRQVPPALVEDDRPSVVLR